MKETDSGLLWRIAVARTVNGEQREKEKGERTAAAVVVVMGKTGGGKNVACE